MEPINPPFCCRCLQPFESGDALPTKCGECLQGGYYGRLFAVGAYGGLLGELIKKLKLGKDLRVARSLGALMMDLSEIKRKAHLYDTVIPVPLYVSSLKERGFNQSGLLAEAVSGEFGTNYERTALVKESNTSLQTALERNKRLENLKGAFRAKRSFWGETCLLVDDVYTTGTTAEECAKVLRRAGAACVDVLTVARTT